MTASMATGIVSDSPVSRRPQPAGRARPQEWQTLYEKQLAQQRPHTFPENTGDPDGSPSAAQSAAPLDERREPGSRVVVVAAGGHLQLQVVDRDGSATTPDPGFEPIATAAAEPPPVVLSCYLAIAASGAPPQKAARTERSSGRGAPPPSPADGRQPVAPVSGPTTSPAWAEPERAMASALETPDTWALPAAVAARAGGPPDSQHSAGQPPASENPIDAVAAAAVAAQSVAAAPGSSAGSTQQHGNSGMEQRRTPGDAVAPDGASGRHYGTFPLIVSGQLLELEFVALRARPALSAAAAVRRIFVSVQPPGMRRLELTVQNLGGRVTVSVGGQEVNSGIAGALDVPALLQRLGWGAYPMTVEGVTR